MCWAASIDRFIADGLTPVLAVELEFYLVDPRRARDGTVRACPPRLQPRHAAQCRGLWPARARRFPALFRRAVRRDRRAGHSARKRDFRIRARPVRADAAPQARRAARLRRCDHVQAARESGGAAARSRGHLHGQTLRRTGGQRHAYPCLGQRCFRHQHLRQRRPRRHPGIAPRHRRHDGDGRRCLRALRPAREQLSPVQGEQLRPRCADLGRQQPPRGRSASPLARRRAATSSIAPAAPTPIPIWRSPPCWQACTTA